MNGWEKAFCRVYQAAFRIALPVLPYRSPKVYESVEALEEIMSDLQPSAALLEKQRSYFATGATLPVRFRREMPGKLYAAVKKRQDEIAGALQKDLGKSEYESFMCEIGLTLSEITYMRRHVGALARKRRVHTPMRYQPYRRLYRRLLTVFLR